MALRHILSFALFLFCFVFPKGGIKIAGIPLTWGYLAFLFLTLASLFRRPLHLAKDHLISFMATLPLLITFTLSLLINGSEHLGFTLSFFFTFLLIPFGCYIVFSDIIATIDLKMLHRLLRISMLFLATYGIVLFGVKQLSGVFFELPYLTVNAQDSGLLETTKHIDRGGLFKLISTYNNGNLYGICLLMLLPIYNLSEPKRLFRIIVKCSLLLTLSRTVWFGLIFCEVLHQLYVTRPSKKSWLGFPLSIGSYLFSIHWLSSILDREADFLTDSSLGGREAQFSTLDTFSLVGSTPFAGIQEIIYLGFLDQLGIVGLLSLLLALITPLFLSYEKTSVNRAIQLGLVTYLFTALSDGAILYIPTMLIYFFLSSLMLRKSLVQPLSKAL